MQKSSFHGFQKGLKKSPGQLRASGPGAFSENISREAPAAMAYPNTGCPSLTGAGDCSVSLIAIANYSQSQRSRSYLQQMNGTR